jgi:hypothetical protein
MPILIRECEDCHGTGLYSGMCEAEGEAVICLGCDGTGRATMSYQPYRGRRVTGKAKKIRKSNGRLLVGPIGGEGNPFMTYAEFLKFVPAKKFARGG